MRLKLMIGTRSLPHLLLTALLWANSAASADAQFPDLFELQAQYVPYVELAGPEPTESQVSSYEVSLNVPVKLSDKSYLIPGASYHVDSIGYRDVVPGFDALRSFHAADFSLLYVQLLPRDVSLALRFAPGLAGDFKRVDSGLVRYNAVVMATKSFSPRLVFGGGGMTTFRFGSFLALPALYLAWEPSASFKLETFLPAFVEATYRIGSRVELGARAEVNGNAYAVRDAGVADDWPCTEQVDDPTTAADESVAQERRCLDHVAYSLASAGLTARVRLFSSVWFALYGGYTLFRRLEPMNARDRRVPGEVQDLPNAPVFRASLIFRIPSD